MITNLWEYNFLILESLYDIIKLPSAPKIFYVSNQSGSLSILVPYNLVNNKFYMKTSSHMCFSAKKILVINDVDDPLSFSFSPMADMILTIKTGEIHNLTAEPVEINFVDYNTRSILKKLDTIDQPYPKDFAINDKAFYELYKTINIPQNIDYLSDGENLLNRISKIYYKLGIEVCHTDIFRIEENKDILIPLSSLNDKIFLKIRHCGKKYSISGILLGRNNCTDNRLIVFVTNNFSNRGYIFDHDKILPKIVKYISSKLTSINFVIPTDSSNILLSYYIGLLYLINDNMSLDQINAFVDPLVKDNLPAIITRLLMAMS